MCTHSSQGVQKRAPDPLELGSQVVVSLLMKLLGTELRSMRNNRLFFFFFNVSALSACTHVCQKRASDLIDGCKATMWLLEIELRKFRRVASTLNLRAIRLA